MNNKTAGRELTMEEVDLVSGGDINLGPIRLWYSEDSAGWCYGEHYGQIRY